MSSSLNDIRRNIIKGRNNLFHEQLISSRFRVNVFRVYSYHINKTKITFESSFKYN